MERLELEVTDERAELPGRLLTGNELAVFSRAMEEWAQQLPSRQRAFLRQVLVNALEAAVEDISGFVEPSLLLEYHETESEDFVVAPSATITAILSSYVQALLMEMEDDPGGALRART
jgi:hypothetical protein